MSLTELAKTYLNTLRSSGAAAALPVIDQMTGVVAQDWNDTPPETRGSYTPYYRIIEVVLGLLEPRVSHPGVWLTVAGIYHRTLTQQVFTPGVKMGLILATYEVEKVLGVTPNAEVTTEPTPEPTKGDDPEGDDQIKELVLAALSPLKRQVLQNATFTRYGSALVISGPTHKEVKRLTGAIKQALPWCDEVSS